MKSVPVRAGSNRIPLGPGDGIQPWQAPSSQGTQLHGFGGGLVKPGRTCFPAASLVPLCGRSLAGQLGSSAPSAWNSLSHQRLLLPFQLTLPPPLPSSHRLSSSSTSPRGPKCTSQPAGLLSLVQASHPLFNLSAYGGHPHPFRPGWDRSETEPGAGPSPKNAGLKGGGGRRILSADLCPWSHVTVSKPCHLLGVRLSSVSVAKMGTAHRPW